MFYSQIFEEKIRSLEASQNLLISHKTELQSSITKLQTEITEHKELILKAEEKAAREKKSKDDLISEYKSQLVCSSLVASF